MCIQDVLLSLRTVVFLTVCMSALHVRQDEEGIIFDNVGQDEESILDNQVL